MKATMTFKFILLVSIVVFGLDVRAQTETKREDTMKVLIHITNGPENPTKAALGFLMAKTAVDEGYAVTLFLAGDAVQLLRNDVLDNLAGLGTGKLKDHYDTIVNGGGKFYLSGMSGKSRGLNEADLKGKPAEFAMPKVLLQLSVDSDRMFVY
ncbi:DsrE family protein [Aquiflexum sp. LQ15W]|uniref:DsrE family protein n=1 Tax=Cognataquiflexum nitidum TaxID=2922272 RepID=UPI001F12F88D|nr:DsrE family protein [Cognataquiflexum nitidum]MCH6202044.1 DsrE family protein [Cognataquiflexum nitidum]